jgi:hypothetical protein
VDDDVYALSGITNAVEEKRRGSPEDVVKLAAALDDISDHALMRDFSRQKSLLVFLREAKQDVIDRFIRPRIDRANRRAVETAAALDIPVFLKTGHAMEIFYRWSRLDIAEGTAHCLFNFIKDSRGFRYFISLTSGNDVISLRKKPGIILSDKPCVILSGSRIYMVENIEGKKLTPFFYKGHIDIPAHTEAVYIKNFVIRTMLSYEVKISGIPVRWIKPSKQACLSLERDFAGRFTLILSFRYEDSLPIYPDNPKTKVVSAGEDRKGPFIICYKRDMAWEGSLIDILCREGLEAKDAGRFYLPGGDDGDSTQESTCGAGAAYRIVEWLNRREGDRLKGFVVESRLDEHLFTGPVVVSRDLKAGIDWFEVNIEIIAGRFRLPFSCFAGHIMERRKEYTLPDGTVFILPDEWFEKYQGVVRYGSEKDGVFRLGKRYASLIERAEGKEADDDKLKAVREILLAPVEHPPLPSLSPATLREYQKEGFYWLEHIYKHRFGGCLADDMGLGKTLQTIALLKHIYDTYDGATPLPASLVVAPTSLLHNWRNELGRFAPDLAVMVYVGERRLRNTVTGDVGSLFDGCRVVITSYGIMRNDIDCLSRYAFNVVILDESQYIKNPSSQAYHAALQLNATHRLTLTGTPLENSLEDLWAQFNFLNEGLLGDLPSFKRDFIQPITKESDRDSEDLLKTIIKPFLLRRTKEEVTPELPPLIEETILCDMTEDQLAVYDKEKNSIRNLIIEAKELATPVNRGFVALQWLNKLRQIANHPRLIDEGYMGGSGKFEQIILSFESLRESRHKVIIFSSYVKYINLLTRHFDGEGWKYALLTGSTVNREEEIRRFSENSDISCFFISLKAGSTGLNLTAADYVFIIDPWWNPAAEMQAMSRAHRIGQEKTVIAYRFISTGTIEEKIQRLQASKTVLYNTFINSSASSQFTTAEVEELLK